ncbi:MAG: methyl-accepting chemotaxis protein [Magnetococcales bacterium]|nr:methyl-accepting chemotaxis protein [Magnetococcales bacterium]NGZ06094.1 methyl-accepting chemotaxis protein [Magnetococcales bacterium]
MRLDDFPIRLKLPLTIGIGLFLFAGVVLFHTLTLRQTILQYEHLLEHELKIQSTARAITIEVLQARRAEKDFMQRLDPSLLEKVDQRIQQADQAAREMQRLSIGSGVEEEVAARMVLLEHLDRYRTLMREIGSDWQAKGLTHRDGLQGVFNQAARALEEGMQRLDRGAGEESVSGLAAMVDYLSMRRMEKNYLLRQDEESATEVEKWATGLNERLRRALRSGKELERLENLLLEYRNAFRSLVTLDRALDEKMNRLRNEIRQVEPLAEEIDAMAARLATQGASDTRRNAEQTAQAIFLISLTTILLCGWLTLRMVRGLVRAISALSHFAREVANGNLDATTALTRGDEIGHLAEVMRAMVQRMRAIRLIADRLVVILALIGRGAIPEPLEVEFHGDFKKITDALNDLIARLSAIRQMAVSMDRISRGEIPEKLAGEYHGEFRRLHESMNVIIDKLREIGGLPTTVQ